MIAALAPVIAAVAFTGAAALAIGTIAVTVAPQWRPPGWAADGRGGCNWRCTGSPFDIAEFEVIQ